MSLLTEILTEAEQGSELWNKIRLGKFTSSKAKDWVCKTGKITGTALTLIAEKAAEQITGVSQDSDFESDDMRWGTEHEPIARQMYIERTGLEVTVPGFILFDEYSGGSPDGLVEPEGGVEIKCPGKSKNHLKNCLCNSAERLKELRPEHYWQIMDLMRVTGRKWWHFVSFDPRVTGAEFFLLHIKRDEKEIEILTKSKELCTAEMLNLLNTMKGA